MSELRTALLATATALAVGGCGLGPDDPGDETKVRIQGVVATPGTEVGLGDTVVLVMTIDPTTYDRIDEVSRHWGVSPSTVDTTVRGDTLVVVAPGYPLDISVTATAKITVENKHSVATVVHVLDLVRPKVTWTNLAHGRTYLQIDTILAFTVGSFYQRAADSLTLIVAGGGSVLLDTAAAAQTISHSFDLTRLLGEYTVEVRAYSQDRGGLPVQGCDTLGFVVNAADVLPKVGGGRSTHDR